MKRWLANKLLKHLFNAVTEYDVLRFDGIHLWHRGRVLTQAEVQDLKSQADVMNHLALWVMLSTELKYTANEMIYQKSKTVDDLLFGKAVLYAVDVMQKKIDQIAKLK